MRQLLFRFSVLGGWSAWLLLMGRQPSLWVWQLVGGLTAWYAFAHMLERRDLRGTGINLLLAGADSAAILAICMSLKALPLAAGVIGLVPLVSFWRARFDGWSWAPLWGALPIAAANVERVTIDPLMLTQAVIAAGLCATSGWILNRKNRTAESAPAQEVPEMPVAFAPIQALVELDAPAPAPAAEPLWERPITPIPDLASRLLETPRTPQALAQALQKHADADGLAIYVPGQGQPSFHVFSTAGDVPFRIRTEEIAAQPGVSEVRLRAEALAMLRDPEDASPMGTLVIRHKSQPSAILWFSARSPEALKIATDRLESQATLIGKFLAQIQQEESHHTRLLELETAYRVATVVQGSETPRTLLARAARDLFANFPVDHVSVGLVHEDEIMMLARHGAPCKLHDKVSWSGQTGLGAWLSQGAPDTLLNNTHDSGQVSPTAAVAERLGSFALFSIGSTIQPNGFLMVACHRKGAFTPELSRALKRVATELGWAQAQLHPSAGPTGLVGHEEFQSRVVEGGGVLVVLKAVPNEETASVSLTDSMTTMSRIAHLLRGALPPHAAITWRECDVLAFLPGFSHEVARSWANQALDVVNLHEGARRGVTEPKWVFTMSVTPLGEQTSYGETTGSEAIPA